MSGTGKLETVLMGIEAMLRIGLVGAARHKPSRSSAILIAPRKGFVLSAIQYNLISEVL